MKKRLVIGAIMLSLMMAAGGGRIRASGHETHYTVIYTCTCSPGCYGTIVGEWDVDCDGNWSGWGWRPDEYPYCSTTQTDIGAFCGPDYPNYP